MLTHITINNFTLVEHLDLDFKRGMTAITGETGTGKSILLDALSMTLGERADGDSVRHGCQRADITATFSLDDLPDARDWLIENDLSHADECLLRRVITHEGRSRSLINGQPVTLQQTKALSQLLIDVHSQHAHQSLLLKTTHQRLLDQFGQHLPLADKVAALYHQWQSLRRQFIQLRDNADEMQAHYKLLSYQVEELDQLALYDGELHQLEEEQKQLANAENILNNSQTLADYCEDDEQGLQQQLRQALKLLDGMNVKSDTLHSAETLLNNALIHIEEASSEIRQQIDRTELNPERLSEVNERLSACYDIARKHHIQPEELVTKYQELQEELSHATSGDDALETLKEEMTQAAQAYEVLAIELSEKRKIAATTLAAAVNKQLHTLSMNHANFLVALGEHESHAKETTPLESYATANGIDQIEFLICTNPGNPHKPLAKVASGGELSRISLAIQVATAQTSHVATLVFDEVDVGIGGATADVVGKLLSELGGNSQVICVTHLAQVASKADQHWQVSKHSDNGNTQSAITELRAEDQVEEIARMISGDTLSEESLAHASMMINNAVH